jgi:hypothetical protein
MIAFLLCLATLLYILEPLFIASTSVALKVSGNTQTDKIALLDRKERSLRAIKDLDLDFKMGKLSQLDYEASRNELSLEVAEMLSKLGGRAP